MGIQGNPYFDFLSRLCRDEEESAPRCPNDFQFYMRHDNYREAVNTRYSEEYPDEPKARQLTTRCKVAAQMLAEESEEVRALIKRECDAAHAADLERHKDDGEGLPSVDPDVQRE
jgi:hypothetical protein